MFYLLASGWVSPPDPEDPPLPPTGFFGFYENFGPLIFWPNIEFWLPSINLFGAISIGALLMMITLSGLMTISVVLFIYSLKMKQQNIKFTSNWK